ncbi:MAG TPA: PQQ-binding-like beta-propeller repeat protein [Vicinamibacterales bacterium]|jgi:outer membrane protein assembly factor BamB
MRRLFAAAIVLALGMAARAVALDWPQFLGPDRNGTYAGPPLNETWGPSGPKVVWRKQVGQGFAGPAVVQGRVLLFHRVGNEEVLESLDAKTGMSTWRYAYPTTYRDDFGFDEGPRAVPVVTDGIVYTFGAQAQLHAVDLAKGTRVWSHDAMKEFGVPKGFFGQGGSPLVEGGRVIANVGGAKGGVIAFDAKTGQVAWAATSDNASYSSGVAATIGGHRTAVFLTRDNLLGLDPATGMIQFQRRWRSRNNASVNAATPLVVGDQLFVSSEYGPGAAVMRVEGSKLVDLWNSDDVLSNHYATSVYKDGYLYGYHGRQEFGPSFRAVEFKTGTVKWSQDQFRAGSVLLAGDRLLILREGGEMILAPASPQAFKPIARAQILNGVVRPYAALADGFLYVRNENTLLCLDLRKQ